LFDIIQFLRTARQPVTAATLTAEVEVNVRTIYRDIVTLPARRVPIEGAAGLGYVLRRGFDLPPLMFTADELDAIAVGARLVRRLPAFGRASARKIEDMLVGAGHGHELDQLARRRQEADEPGDPAAVGATVAQDLKLHDVLAVINRRGPVERDRRCPFQAVDIDVKRGHLSLSLVLLTSPPWRRTADSVLSGMRRLRSAAARASSCRAWQVGTGWTGSNGGWTRHCGWPMRPGRWRCGCVRHLAGRRAR
jgi:hypothetical protein